MNIEQKIQSAMKEFNASTLTELKFNICNKMQILKVKANNWDTFAATQLNSLNAFLQDIENFEHQKHNTAKAKKNDSQPIYAVCCDYDEQTWVLNLTLNLKEAKAFMRAQERKTQGDHNYHYYILQKYNGTLKTI